MYGIHINIFSIIFHFVRIFPTFTSEKMQGEGKVETLTFYEEYTCLMRSK